MFLATQRFRDPSKPAEPIKSKKYFYESVDRKKGHQVGAYSIGHSCDGIYIWAGCIVAICFICGTVGFFPGHHTFGTLVVERAPRKAMDKIEKKLSGKICVSRVVKYY